MSESVKLNISAEIAKLWIGRIHQKMRDSRSSLAEFECPKDFKLGETNWLERVLIPLLISEGMVAEVVYAKATKFIVSL
jgi:hypothetical protein